MACRIHATHYSIEERKGIPLPAGYIFWTLMLLWAVFGCFGFSVPTENPYRNRIIGGWGLLTFVLFFLLGWKTFGFVVQ